LASVDGLDNYNEQMNHECQVCLSEKPESDTGQGFSVLSGLDFRAHIPKCLQNEQSTFNIFSQFQF